MMSKIWKFSVKKIREQIKLIDSKQNTFIENLNEQNILINDNNFKSYLEFNK